MLADLVSKFIYSLYIYSGKNLEAEVRVPRSLVQAGAAYEVVMNLLHRFENKWYCNIMDNVFVPFHFLGTWNLWKFIQRPELDPIKLDYLCIWKIQGHGEDVKKSILNGPCMRVEALVA